jgi:hypothetical protein
MLDALETDHAHPQELEAEMVGSDRRPVLGYNAQAVVDHESDLIVAIGLSRAGSDNHLLVPMLAQVTRVLGAVAERTVADAGYFSGEQIAEAHMRKLPVLVEVQEQGERGVYPKSRFTYDAARDGYTCPAGKWVPKQSTRQPSGKTPYVVKVYRCDPSDCPLRAECTKSKVGRIIKRTPYEADVERQAATNLQPRNAIARSLRKETVEHIFGCIKSNDGFDRFTVGGPLKALAQWALAATALNLRKLWGAWCDGVLSFRPAAGHL